MSHRRRCSCDEIRRELIKVRYSTGLQFARCQSGRYKRIQLMLKWPLDLPFTADYKVRTYRNVFLFAYFNLIRVKTCERTKIYA